MSILSSIKQNFKVGLFAALVIGSGALALNGTANAISLTGGQDCDANAVIYCGAQSTQSLISKYTSGTTQNSAKSIHDIYTKFGISAAEVNAMNNTAVAGSVTKGGDVIVAGKVVAKNALTAGREDIAGSTKVTSNGTTFYTRAPSVSFNSASIPAFVVLKDGVFQYAVLESCANPVTATPVLPPAEHPKYTINKLVAVKGSTNFAKKIAVVAGTHVTYQITVESTGDSPADNVNVKDTLPANVTYVPGTLTRNTHVVAGTDFFTKGDTLTTLHNGAKVTYQFEAIVGATAGTCKAETLTNTGSMTSTNLGPESSTAVVSETCTPVQTATAPTCNNFDIAAGDNRTIRVTKFDYTANDAKFVSAVINWDMNKTNVSTAAITDTNAVVGQTHQYAADGTYLVGVTVTFTSDGKTVTATGVQCEKQVTFSTKPPVVTTPPAIPTAPVALVNTGAGSTAALFGGASVIAFAAYQWSLRRRLSL